MLTPCSQTTKSLTSIKERVTVWYQLKALRKDISRVKLRSPSYERDLEILILEDTHRRLWKENIFLVHDSGSGC